MKDNLKELGRLFVTVTIIACIFTAFGVMLERHYIQGCNQNKEKKMNLTDLQDQKSILWEKPRRCEVATERVVSGTAAASKTEWETIELGKGHCYGGNVSQNKWIVELDSGQGMVCSFAEIKFIHD